MRRVKQKLRKLTETPDESLCDEASGFAELASMLKSLEPITKQVEDLKGNMSQCVEDVDNLSMVDLLRVVSEIGESMSYTCKTTNTIWLLDLSVSTCLTSVLRL